MREDRSYFGRVADLGPLLWWGLMAAVLLESVAAGGCRGSSAERTGLDLTPAAPCPRPAGEPVLKVTAGKLDHDFAYLKAASADATYRGKWLAISGTLVRAPRKAADGGWEMLLATHEGSEPLKLSFPGSCLWGQRARLSPRSRITATCRINDTIEIVDCSLL
jgi:hypothetical protein